MLKNTKDIIFKIFFLPIVPMGALRYSCPIRLVPTYSGAHRLKPQDFNQEF